jgi:hypothetical protein
MTHWIRGFRLRRRSVGLVVALATALAVPASASAATVFVDDDSANTSATCGSTAATANAPTSACDTIQKGVDAANSTDTVQVAAGNYPEQVDIGKPISVVGAGQGSTVIDPAFADLVDKYNVDGGGDRRPIVFAHSASGSVNISALTVDGGAGGPPSDCGPDFEGITYLEASGTVNTVTVAGIRASAPSGCQSGLGIYNLNGNGDGSGDDASHTFTVANSTVTNFQKNGITANDTNLTATITNNLVQNSGAPEPIAQNGIQLGYGAGGSVAGNPVRNLAVCNVASDCGPDPVLNTQGAGILVFDAPASAVSGNTVTGNEVGLLQDGGTGPLLVQANNISNNLYENVFSDDGTMNLVQNQLNGSNIGVSGVGYSTGGPVAPTINIGGNNILGNDIGISRAREDTSAPSPTLLVRFNRIVGNSLAGIDNTAANTGGVAVPGAIDAINNWWGCNPGPNTSSCDDTAGTVNSNPWLVFGVNANPTSVTPGGTSQVTADLLRNSAGQTVNGGFPDGVSVAFGATLGTVTPASSTTSIGRASSSFTAGNALGTGTVTGTLDNQSVTTPITIAAAAGGNGTTAQQQPSSSAACSNTIAGDSGANTLKGTSAGDRLKGKGGDDKLSGKGGDDCLKGGSGDDTLKGGAGKDRLRGGSGDDVIKAKDGAADIVRCGGGSDVAKVDSEDDVRGCETTS